MEILGLSWYQRTVFLEDTVTKELGNQKTLALSTSRIAVLYWPSTWWDCIITQITLATLGFKAARWSGKPLGMPDTDPVSTSIPGVLTTQQSPRKTSQTRIISGVSSIACCSRVTWIECKSEWKEVWTKQENWTKERRERERERERERDDYLSLCIWKVPL